MGELYSSVRLKLNLDLLFFHLIPFCIWVRFAIESLLSNSDSQPLNGYYSRALLFKNLENFKICSHVLMIFGCDFGNAKQEVERKSFKFI